MKSLFILLGSISVFFISISCDKEIAYSSSDKDLDLYVQKLGNKIVECNGASYIYRPDLLSEVKLLDSKKVQIKSFDVSPVDKEQNRISWNGLIKLNVKAYRYYDFVKMNWSNWAEVPNDGFGLISLTKKNGIWDVQEKDRVENISCENIPFLNSKKFDQINIEAKREAEEYFPKVFSKCNNFYFTIGHEGRSIWRTKEILPNVYSHLITDNEFNSGVEWKGIVRLSQVEHKYSGSSVVDSSWLLLDNYLHPETYWMQINLTKDKSGWKIDAESRNFVKPSCNEIRN